MHRATRCYSFFFRIRANSRVIQDFSSMVRHRIAILITNFNKSPKKILFIHPNGLVTRWFALGTNWAMGVAAERVIIPSTLERKHLLERPSFKFHVKKSCWTLWNSQRDTWTENIGHIFSKQLFVGFHIEIYFRKKY